jgi:cell division protein ZapD
MTNKAMITYEQPLNELIRICLRLEYLFGLIKQGCDTTDSRQTIRAMLDILSITERPDLRTKLVKTLSSHAEHLSLLEKNPNIDKEKLSSMITELDTLIDILHSQPGRIGQELRENEFLNSIRQRLSMPAGECPFNLPAYQAWLQKPILEKELQIKSWLKAYQHLQAANALILMLTRSSAHSETVMIQDGFYQQSLDSNHVGQLMRLVIPFEAQNPVYPEISVGPQRFSIRLQRLDSESASLNHCKEAITCQIKLCYGPVLAKA